jgi:hypothetical protein
LIERLPNGKVFEIGPVRACAPGERLVVGWRHACLGPGHATAVQVTFEPVGSKTRASMEHRGWDSAPQAHVARHGIPLQLTNQRQGEPWRAGLERLSQRTAETVPPRLPD